MLSQGCSVCERRAVMLVRKCPPALLLSSLHASRRWQMASLWQLQPSCNMVVSSQERGGDVHHTCATLLFRGSLSSCRTCPRCQAAASRESWSTDGGWRGHCTVVLRETNALCLKSSKQRRSCHPLESWRYRKASYYRMWGVLT